MFGTWQNLVSTEKLFILFLRLTLLHEIKENEKYPYAYPSKPQKKVDYCIPWETIPEQ